MNQNAVIPVITIDGPTASGKGTVAQAVAKALGWHVLDSGALYRLTALLAIKQGKQEADETVMASLASNLDVVFTERAVLLQGNDVSDAIRHENVGLLASKIAAYQSVRQALLQRQRDFRQPPGLVADGRDMGTVVFPDAPLKVFLQASVETRALRRYKQLISKGISANLADLTKDLQNRDINDSQRLLAPLVPAKGSVVIDSSNLSIDETVSAVLNLWSDSVHRHA